MTISTLAMYQYHIRNFNNICDEYNKNLKHLSSNKIVNYSADDPHAYSIAQSCLLQINTLESYKTSRDLASNNLISQNTVLTQMADNLGSILQPKLVSAGSEISVDNKILAKELKEIRDTMVALANSTNSSGYYMFSGMLKETQPFNSQGEYQGGRITVTQPINQFSEVKTSFLAKDIFVKDNETSFFNKLDQLITCLDEEGKEHIIKDEIIPVVNEYINYCLNEIDGIKTDIAISLNQIEFWNELDSSKRIDLTHDYQQVLGSDNGTQAKILNQHYMMDMALKKSVKVMEYANEISIFNQ